MKVHMKFNISQIVDQHAEEASFLWILRDAAVRAPHYDLKDLAHLDDRLDAHLDGLRIAGEAGWAACDEQLQFQEPGEVFAAAVLALESGEAARIRSVYEVVGAAPETQRGLVSAFGWVDRAWWRGEVRDLLVAESPFWRRLGLATATQRVDPGRHLTDALEASDPRLRETPQLLGLGFGIEPAHVETEDQPLRADGLAAAIRAALTEAGTTLAATDFRIVDVSGEQYGFKEATLALIRLLRVRKAEYDIWHPVDCIGEAGAAILSYQPVRAS